MQSLWIFKWSYFYSHSCFAIIYHIVFEAKLDRLLKTFFLKKSQTGLQHPKPQHCKVLFVLGFCFCYFCSVRIQLIQVTFYSHTFRKKLPYSFISRLKATHARWVIAFQRFHYVSYFYSRLPFILHGAWWSLGAMEIRASV